MAVDGGSLLQSVDWPGLTLAVNDIKVRTAVSGWKLLLRDFGK